MTTPAAGTGRFAAVDLGASSGRVFVGEVGPDRLELTEVHRFGNRPVRLTSGLHWDVLGLYSNVLGAWPPPGEAAPSTACTEPRSAPQPGP